MNFSYTPKRLQCAKEDIVLIHQKTSEAPKMTKNEELRKMILSLVALEQFQVKPQAYALTSREIDLVAGYIPHNYFNVDMKNLFRIFTYRSTDRLCQILFNQWQDSYHNRACNKFMREILVYDEHLIVLAQNNHMPETMFDSVLQDHDIATRFGKEIKKRNFTGKKSLAERLAYFGIRGDSQLYLDCEFLFYTYCDKEDYLNVQKLSLLNLVKQYSKRSQETLKDFLQNFLSKLELKELLSFKELAMFLQTITGDNGENKSKFENFFNAFDSLLVRKYINWINLYKVEEYFGYDERSSFWKQYKFESVRKYSYSNAVVMEFERYYAVEFLGRAMGPIYMYSKDYFEKNIIMRFKWNDNQQMRQELLHNSTWVYRKEHRGYWQGDVHSILIHNRITERLNI